MIIPTIDLQQESLPDMLAEQVAWVRHWGVLGQLAVRGISAETLDCLEMLLQRIGGAVDVMVQLEVSDTELERDALRLLNAGAMWVLSTTEQADAFDTIPFDRTRQWLTDPSVDDAIAGNHVVALTAPTAERVAELEMARVDVLISIEQLESEPTLVTDAIANVMVTDRPDGLWSTVIVDRQGVALGLAYSDQESLEHAWQNRVGAYHSRSRGGLWIKGASSGATQTLLGIRLDCDRDCLQFKVIQDPPGFCHRDTYTCFGHSRTIQSVTQRLLGRMAEADENSFTKKLAQDPSMLAKKLLEEAGELAEASQQQDSAEVTWEAADVLYFSLVAMLNNGVSVGDVHEELARRMNRVVRRKNKLETDREN